MNEAPLKTWVICHAIIKGADGKFLALRRSKTDPARPLTWDLPGGIVEYGENPVDATIRESLEEAGQTIDNLKPVIVTSGISARGYGIIVVFLAEAQSEVVALSFEHDQYQWITREEFLALESSDHIKTFMRSVKLD